MKYLTLVLLSLFLQGCFYQSCSENDIKLGQLFCKSKNSELEYIEVWWIGSETVHCKNNEVRNLNSLTAEQISKM